MEIRIKTYNEDGSIAFDGVFDKNEASVILEVGVSYLLSQGALATGVATEEEDGDGFTVDGNDTLQ